MTETAITKTGPNFNEKFNLLPTAPNIAPSSVNVNALRQEIYEITIDLGGTITAEHGIGLSKIDYLNMALEPGQIDIMKKIKRIFDPKNILNPGKIFPD